MKLKQNRTSLPPIRRDPPPIQRDSLPKPSYQSNLPSKQPAAAVISSSNGLSNGLGSNHVSSSRPQLNKPSVPDIARRPIKYVRRPLTLHPLDSVFFNQSLRRVGGGAIRLAKEHAVAPRPTLARPPSKRSSNSYRSSCLCL